MTREEAARDIDNTACCFSDKRFRDAMHMAAAALRGPQPDPITGLLPCGCGGEAKVWPSDLRQAMVTAYQVGCTKCATTTVWVRGKQENAVKVWNTAMSGGMCNHENGERTI